MQKELCSKTTKTTKSNIADDTKEVMNKNVNVSPSMKLFCEQQKSSQNKGSGVHYHLMIIRFCLLLGPKSASAYKEFSSSSDELILPRLRASRDYKNTTCPNIGFKNEVIEELCKTTETFGTISILGYTCNLPVKAA